MCPSAFSLITMGKLKPALKPTLKNTEQNKINISQLKTEQNKK